MPSLSGTLWRGGPSEAEDGLSPGARHRRLRSGRSVARVRLAPDHWALLAIAVAVLLANLPYLLGLFHPDPLDYRAGLSNAITNGLLGGRPTIDPSAGFTSQAIGHLAALDLLHLHLPWWNPYEATGMPLLGETQSAALFPPTLLTALANGQLYEHVLLELIAGASTYFLLRRLSVARSAAIAGAIAFALNGKFAWFSDAGVNPVPFLPMLLLGIERAFAAARDGRRAGWRLIAVAGALTIYAGFPEVAYIDVLVAVCWFGWRFFCLDRARFRSFLIKAALGAAAGILLAAPMLVAMLDYLPHAFQGVHAGSQLGTHHLHVSELPQLVMPYVYGPLNADRYNPIWILVGGYLTAILLLFAVLGLLSPGRRGLKLTLVGWTLLAFAHMYDAPPLLGHILGSLPGMDKVQFYRYGTAAIELPVIVLAALGLDDLARVSAHRRRLLWGGVGAAAAVGLVALLAWPVVSSWRTRFPAFPYSPYFYVSLAWGVLTAAAAAAIALVRHARARAALLTALVAIDAIAMFAVPEFSAPRATTVDLAPVAYLRRHLGEERFYTLGPLRPNFGSYFRLASFGVDDFPPKRYVHYVHKRLDPFAVFTGFQTRGPLPLFELTHHLDRYGFASVRYIVTPSWEPLQADPSKLRLVLRTPSSLIYELTRAAPYFEARGCQVSSDNRQAASVSCPQPTTLIRRETWFAGWSAQVDGRPARVHRIDGFFQAVTVPAGSHRVTFSFVPPDMGWALLGLLAGCGLMCAPVGARGVVRASRSATISSWRSSRRAASE